MLQPVELQDVSARFAEGIESLRKFLSQASVPVGGPSAAQAIASRLGTDRAFHRDLMSHIWVLMDESSTPPRYADLLGMVAIAAAGLQGAADIDEDDAHILLRFLMESKHTLEGTPTRTETVTRSVAASSGRSDIRPLGWTAPDASLEQRRRMPSHSSGDPVLPAPRARDRVREEDTPRGAPARPGNRRTLVIAGIALCLAAALSLGYAVLHRQSSTTGDGAVAIKSSSPAEKAPQTTVFVPEPAPAAGTGQATPEGFRNAAPSSNAQRSGNAFRAEPARSGLPVPRAYSDHLGATGATTPPPAVSMANNLPAPPPSVPPSVSSVSSAGGVAVAAPAAGAPVTLKGSRSAPQPPAAVPATTLTARLDSPRLPAYAADPEDAKGRKYPRLLRRHAAGTMTDSAPDSSLSAELRAPDLPGTPAASRSSAAASRAIVHSTCIGMMAGNLVYGPTPAYPTAAVSAHVQGEVKIQATIDRDGTVNAARVVSGPPLLRDAALDAVQHWRYKPYVAGGKPAPTGTMAVVNFELP